ncbi:hypothetical protein GCM10009682_36960 [Luedemannella flava]|uniref:Nuclear transport factor 2 family protein n=1 Tax=Luedemannella flava TaxID=349316 RepID=A0ABN2M7Z7_9ACTN
MRTGDFAQFGKGFADDAVLRFDGVPVGPFRGRPAIVDAYVTQPPMDTMALTSMEEIGGDAVRASFEWDAGGTGNLFLRWAGADVVELVIAFD